MKSKLLITTLVTGGGPRHVVRIRARQDHRGPYFEQWPTANQVAQVEKTYDDALGVEGGMAGLRQRQRDEPGDGLGRRPYRLLRRGWSRG